jgi:hypothetical protein
MGKNNKRPLDRDSEKTSPPCKMPGSAKSAESEILSKLSSFESKVDSRFESFSARFTSLEKEVTDIARALREIEAVRVEVGNLRSEVEGLKVAVQGYQRLEIETKRRSVLVKGLKFESEGRKFETRAQTLKALEKFFTRLNMSPHLVDYYRLGGLREGEDGAKVCVRVQFDDVDQKMAMFEKLKSNGQSFSDVSILTDYPSFQQQDFKILSGKAFELRKATPGIKTRIVPKGLGLVLQTRPNANAQWTVSR